MKKDSEGRKRRKEVKDGIKGRKRRKEVKEGSEGRSEGRKAAKENTKEERK